MLRRFLLGLALGAPFVASAFTWTGNTPSSPVQSGTPYSVKAQQTSGASDFVSLFRGGYVVADGYEWAEYSHTDYGNQEINFSADVYDTYDDDYYVIYTNVDIYVPNSSPSISWDHAPGTAYVNEYFTVRAKGTDPDGNLASVFVDKEGQPFAYNGGGNGYENVTDNNGTSGGAQGSISFSAVATDGASASSGVIYHTVQIIKRYQSVTFNPPSQQVYGTPLSLGATASSGLPISYSVISGPATVSGNVVTFNATGWVTVRAAQVGNHEYHPVHADQAFFVAARSITVTLSGSKVYNGNTTATGASLSVTSGSLASGDSLASYTATTSANAASYPLTAVTVSNASAPTTRTPSYFITYAGSYTISKANQAAVTITSGSAVTYGNAYTATASGGSGPGAIGWSLGTGSTAAGAAIHPSTGAITAQSSGTVVIRAQRAGSTNYHASALTNNFTVTVNARPITLTLSGSKVYNGNTTPTGASASITSGSLAAGDAIGYSYAATSSANQGSYSALVVATVTNGTAPTTRTGSYAITQAGSYTISRAPITAATIASLTYNGSAQSPTTTTATTPAGATVNVSAPSQTNAGTYATATVSGTGNYTGTLTSVSWTINKANQSAVTITSAGSVAYGTSYTATATGGSGTGAIVWSLGTGSTAASAAIHASTGVITAKSSGTVVIRAQRASDANHNASALTNDFTITVNPRPITVTLSGSKVYNGSTTATGASLAVTSGSLASGDSLSSYTTTSSAAANAYPLTAVTITNAGAPTTRTGSYSITHAGSYTINPAPITAATIAALTYSGSPQSPISAAATTPAGATVNVSAPTQTNAGTYNTATVTGTGNYTGTLNNVSWSITQAAQTPVTIVSANSMVYGDVYPADADGGLGEGDYEWSLGTGSTAADAAINASTGAITAKSLGTVVIRVRILGDINYPDSPWTADFTISVTARPITVTLSGSKVYNGTTTATGASLSVSSGSLAPGDSLATYVTPDPDADTYPLTAVTITNAGAPTTRTGNYTITHAGSYTINRAPITAATVAALTYNGTAQSPTAVTGTTPAGATVNVSAPAQTNADTYNTATVTGTGNYIGTITNVPWTINRAIPGATFATPRTRGTQTPTSYTVQGLDLDADFNPVGSGSQPLGEVTYAIVSASGSGASPTSGSVIANVTVLTVGSYTIRASYPGDDNYMPTTIDSAWAVVLDSDGDDVDDYIEAQLGTAPATNNHQEDETNQSELIIDRPNP